MSNDSHPHLLKVIINGHTVVQEYAPGSRNLHFGWILENLEREVDRLRKHKMKTLQLKVALHCSRQPQNQDYLITEQPFVVYQSDMDALANRSSQDIAQEILAFLITKANISMHIDGLISLIGNALAWNSQGYVSLN